MSHGREPTLEAFGPQTACTSTYGARGTSTYLTRPRRRSGAHRPEHGTHKSTPTEVGVGCLRSYATRSLWGALALALALRVAAPLAAAALRLALAAAAWSTLAGARLPARCSLASHSATNAAP